MPYNESCSKKFCCCIKMDYGIRFLFVILLKNCLMVLINFIWGMVEEHWVTYWQIVSQAPMFFAGICVLIYFCCDSQGIRVCIFRGYLLMVIINFFTNLLWILMLFAYDHDLEYRYELAEE